MVRYLQGKALLRHCSNKDQCPIHIQKKKRRRLVSDSETKVMALPFKISHDYCDILALVNSKWPWLHWNDYIHRRWTYEWNQVSQAPNNVARILHKGWDFTHPSSTWYPSKPTLSRDLACTLVGPMIPEYCKIGNDHIVSYPILYFVCKIHILRYQWRIPTIFACIWASHPRTISH